MSNLILPKEHQTPMLDKNLEALFRRYPHERARLTPILSKPAPMFPVTAPILPPPPDKPPIRVLALLGIGSPLFLPKILNDETVKKENFKLFIVEQDAEFAAFCFQQTDLSQIINYPKTEWFICHTVQSIRPALFAALKPEAVTAMMRNVQTLDASEPRLPEAKEFYDKFHQIYMETAAHVIHNHGNLDDSVLGLEVTVRNKKFILNNPGIDDLKDYYKGESVLLVGAGPSLDQSLETIKKYNDRVVVIAADAALKPLHNAGIRVDFVTSMERLNAYQKPFFENLPPVSADLVAYPVVHPDVLDLFPGTVRMVYRNYSFYAYFEKAYPKGILSAGGSTAHLALRLADYMGCRRVFFIGLDSCYEEKDGKYRSHCAGTGHEKWGNFIPLEDFHTKHSHQPPMNGMNNLGQPVITNITYFQWIKEYAGELANLGDRLTIKNCSPIGLQIDGIPYQPLEEALSNLPVLYIEKPKAPAARLYRTWDHRELLKNLSGWKRAAEEGLKETDALLALETVDQERYNALFYVYAFRFMVEDMFVSFVIQCCATEFFAIENDTWALSLDPTADLKEKTQLIKARFELFLRVLNRVIPVFQEGESNGEVHQQGD